MAGKLLVALMRRLLVVGMAGIIVTGLLLPDHGRVEAAGPLVEAALEDELFAYMNDERVARGLHPLQYHPMLREVARMRSWDMANRNYFSHYSPEGLSAFDILDGLGYRRRAQGENIGYNYLDSSRSAASASRMFMGSPPHARAILSRAYRYAGIGEATNSRGARYYTMVFSD